MTNIPLKTKVLPKILIAMTLLPVVAIPVLVVAMGLPISLRDIPLQVGLIGGLAVFQTGLGMAFNISLALLALAYYGKSQALAAHRSRFVMAGRAYAAAIAVNLAATLGLGAFYLYFGPPVVRTVLADGTVQQKMTQTLKLGLDWDQLGGLAMLVAVLLLVDLIDETLRLRDESSLTV